MWKECRKEPGYKRKLATRSVKRLYHSSGIVEHVSIISLQSHKWFWGKNFIICFKKNAQIASENGIKPSERQVYKETQTER